jgi:hypothetical protein
MMVMRRLRGAIQGVCTVAFYKSYIFICIFFSSQGDPDQRKLKIISEQKGGDISSSYKVTNEQDKSQVVRLSQGLVYVAFPSKIIFIFFNSEEVERRCHLAKTLTLFEVERRCHLAKTLTILEIEWRSHLEGRP